MATIRLRVAGSPDSRGTPALGEDQEKREVKPQIRVLTERGLNHSLPAGRPAFLSFPLRAFKISNGFPSSASTLVRSRAEEAPRQGATSRSLEPGPVMPTASNNSPPVNAANPPFAKQIPPYRSPKTTPVGAFLLTGRSEALCQPSAFLPR